MTPNDDLARWGEPPASEQELRQARELAERLEGTGRTDEPPELLEVDSWLQELVTTVLSHSGLAEDPATTVGASGPSNAPPDLRLRVYRLAGPNSHVLVASTHPMPTTLRDLQRVPDDADRVALRTGDRVRLEAVCDRGGHLTVFNVGPAGTFNLLYPDDLGRATAQPAREPLRVANVMLTPPAGRERLYAVWSRAPLSQDDLRDLGSPGVATRDLKRVQDVIDELRPEDWHAVLLMLDHEP